MFSIKRCTLLIVPLILLPMSVTLADVPSMESVRGAVVHLPGGSGVCVSPDGWIVTAAHMLPGWPFESQPGPQAPRRPRLFREPTVYPPTPVSKPPASIQIQFEGSSQFLIARVLAVRDRDEKTDVAILKVDGAQPFPFRPMAGAASLVGSPCYHAGWAGPGNWSWFETHINFVGEAKAKNNGVIEILDLIECNHHCAPGTSGGPLFNLRYEVIGVCSRGANLPKQSTLFARWEHVTACLIESGYSPLSSEISRRNEGVVLQVWTTKTCEPCLKFKADLEKGIDCNGIPLKQAFHIEPYDFDENRVLAQRIGVKIVPTFVVGNGDMIEGYESPEFLARQLCKYQFPHPVNGLQPPAAPRNPAKPGDAVIPPPGGVVPPPDPPGPGVPPPDAAVPPPPGEKPIDVADLRIVVLVAKQGLGSWSLVKGMALSKAESAIEKKAPAIAKEKFGDRLAASVCCERLHPDRFDALVKASGVDEAKFTLVVLVKQRFEGLKERLVQFVEEKAKTIGPIGNQTARLEFIFERTDSETYDAVVDALDLEEDQTTEILGGTAVAGTAIGGWTGWLSRRRRLLRRQPPTSDA